MSVIDFGEAYQENDDTNEHRNGVTLPQLGMYVGHAGTSPWSSCPWGSLTQCGTYYISPQGQLCLPEQAPKMPTQQKLERTSDEQSLLPDNSCLGIKVCFVVVFDMNCFR